MRKTSPPKKDPIPELEEPPRRRRLTDYLTWVVGRAIVVVVMLLLFVICLDYAHPRKVGPPHWSDKYFRAAAWAVVLALLVLGLVHNYWPK